MYFWHRHDLARHTEPSRNPDAPGSHALPHGAGPGEAGAGAEEGKAAATRVEWFAVKGFFKTALANGLSRTENKTSKFLSYVLRHRPDEIGLTLDANGWALVSDLIERSKSASTHLTEEIIRELVRSSDKQRFALSEDGNKIRANQGHSVSVDLALEPKQPPDILLHGTATRFLDAIRQEGLKPMDRQHVHLSPDEATAINVGQRHGKPVVLRIKAREMWRKGILFYLSANGVWLTDRVESTFLEFPA